MSRAESIAEEISTGNLKRKEIFIKLERTIKQNPAFYGGSITFKPYAYRPDRRLYSAYYTKEDGVFKYLQLDKIYDYTQPEYKWYSLAMKKGSRWCEPYFCSAGETLMSTYSAPFYKVEAGSKIIEEGPIGVITIDISLDYIREIIHSLDLGPSGFGALLSKKGHYLYHPNNEFVLTGKTIRELGEELNDKDRISLSDKILKGESGIIDHVSSTTGLSSWLIYESIPTNGWSLNNTFIKDDIQMNVDLLRRQQIRICIFLILFLLSLSFILLGHYKSGEKKLWLFSALTAFFLLIGIGYIWNLALTYCKDNTEDTIRITDQATLNSFMHKYADECVEKHIHSPVYIPTGIFLESVRFANACDIDISGYIWQKYNTNTHRHLIRELLISGAQDVEFTEIYHCKKEYEEIRRWFFQARLTQHFDNSEYPLNQETISVHLLHKDLNHNIVLIPDLAAYRLTNPAFLPGLDKNLLIPGWKLKRSFFNLRQITYDTDFGMDESILMENFPTLSFSVVIRRNFLDSFISSLTPLIVVALLLFSIFFISTRDKEKKKLLGVSTGSTLGFCAGLFFVVVFGHIGIRKEITAQEVFYLEYFYLVMYLVLLWISVNSILLILSNKIFFIQYKDNLISKLLYWPVLLVLLFEITVIFFY
jgi:hypothetical protein